VLQDVASGAQNDGFRLQVDVDRDTAGRLGVSMQTIIDTLSDAFGQRQISTIYGQANQYRVILEAKPEYQNDPTSLTKLYVPRLPTSVIGSYSGDAAEFAKSLAGEPWLILAAAITIYIVLGVLYESFIHPLTILSTLPSAGVGALLALMLYKQDLSVVALIGIVLLMGIVKKNAIMMIPSA
jgi:multidrug efflux pump